MRAVDDAFGIAIYSDVQICIFRSSLTGAGLSQYQAAKILNDFQQGENVAAGCSGAGGTSSCGRSTERLVAPARLCRSLPRLHSAWATLMEASMMLFCSQKVQGLRVCLGICPQDSRNAGSSACLYSVHNYQLLSDRDPLDGVVRALQNRGHDMLDLSLKLFHYGLVSFLLRIFRS